MVSTLVLVPGSNWPSGCKLKSDDLRPPEHLDGLHHRWCAVMPDLAPRLGLRWVGQAALGAPQLVVLVW